MIPGAGRVGHRDGDRVAFDFGRPPRHVPEEVHGQRHIRHSGHADRLPVVERLQLGEFFQVRFDKVGELPDKSSALRGCKRVPRAALEGFPCSGDRPVNFGAVAFGHLGQNFARGWVVGRKGLPGRGFEPSTADQHLPGRAYKSFDLLVNRDFHRCRAHGVPPLWMYILRPYQMRRTEGRDTLLYMNGNTVMIVRGWNL